MQIAIFVFGANKRSVKTGKNELVKILWMTELKNEQPHNVVFLVFFYLLSFFCSPNLTYNFLFLGDCTFIVMPLDTEAALAWWNNHWFQRLYPFYTLETTFIMCRAIMCSHSSKYQFNHMFEMNRNYDSTANYKPFLVLHSIRNDYIYI